LTYQTKKPPLSPESFTTSLNDIVENDRYPLGGDTGDDRQIAEAGLCRTAVLRLRSR
jgi:hypothetical protein